MCQKVERRSNTNIIVIFTIKFYSIGHRSKRRKTDRVKKVEAKVINLVKRWTANDDKSLMRGQEEQKIINNPLNQPQGQSYKTLLV